MAGKISRLIADRNFNAIALYMEPDPAKAAKESLEWEQQSPNGAGYLLMLEKAFASFQNQTPLPRVNPGQVYFQDTTMFANATYPKQNYTPAELATLNTIRVTFYQKDGRWYLANESFGLLVNSTRRAPPPQK